MPPSPLVSVIIPAFNAAAHISHVLESVFAQTFTGCEVILVNDGSSDTEQLERFIQPYLSRITYLKQENRGPSAARNLGIQNARGEWLAFLDSDDSWLPHYLAGQLQFLRSHPELDMVYCDATLEGTFASHGNTYMQVCPSSGPVTFESLLFEQTQPITSGTVVRRLNVVAAGLFDEAIHYSEDHDLWLRIIHTGGKIGYQRTTLLRRSIREGSQGSVPGALLAGEIQTLKKLSQELDLTPDMQVLLARRLRSVQSAHAFVQSKTLLLEGQYKKAVESLSLAHALAPSTKLRAMLTCLRFAPRLTSLALRLKLRMRRKIRNTANPNR